MQLISSLPSLQMCIVLHTNEDGMHHLNTLEIKATALALVSLVVHDAELSTLWHSFICHTYSTTLYSIILIMARHNAIALVLLEDALPCYIIPLIFSRVV